MPHDAPVETAQLRDCSVAIAASSVVGIHAITLPAALQLPTVQVLDSAEQQRWSALHRPDDRDRFVASRALVKAVVAHRLGRHPRGVTVTAVSGQRPQVVGSEACRVSISHTRGLVVVACGTHGDVGVDCEYIDRDLDTATLAERFFSAPEHQALRRLGDQNHTDGFFRLWTGKEALAKASGAGLDDVLHTDLHDLLAASHQAQAGSWSVRCLRPIGDCAVAIAAPGTTWQPAVRCWEAHALLDAWLA